MARPPVALAPAVLVAALLAGCSDPGAAVDDPKFDGLGLQATETTGLIRGVVVDDAVRPIAGARVILRTEPPQETTTGDDGLFGFDSLAPGTYFLAIERLGYFPVQQSAEVVAGVAEPPIVKALLKRDLALTPFWQGLTFEGYIECTTSVLVLCGAPAVLTGQSFTNDRFAWDQYFADNATHLQAEMVWESTQAASPEMYFEMEVLNDDCEDADEDNDIGSFLNSTRGTSPIYATVNATEVAEFSIGSTCPIWMSLFSGAINGTPCFDDVDPTGTAPAWCAGFTVQQRFTMYFHTFHHYTPPSGWRFTMEPPPEPPL